jgi:hypothetical protein
MPKIEKVEGNLILKTEELDELRKAIVERYAINSGQTIHFPDRVFNSNLDNYEALRENIETVGVKLDLRTNKPLAVLFHFSKNDSDGMTTFRKKFINSLYVYACGRGREDFLSTRKSTFASSKEINQFKHIEGYWQCYYDKNGRFSENLRNKKEATLGKLAYWITGDNINNATVQFFQSSRNTGKGVVEVKGNNLILKLENDINSEPQYVFMNCGRDIENSTIHFERIVGCFLHIDDAGSPKIGKCVMFHEPQKSWDIRNPDEIKNFEDSIKFSLEEEEKIEKELRDVKEFFFEDDTNTLTANVIVFKEIIKNSRLSSNNITN